MKWCPQQSVTLKGLISYNAIPCSRTGPHLVYNIFRTARQPKPNATKKICGDERKRPCAKTGCLAKEPICFCGESERWVKCLPWRRNYIIIIINQPRHWGVGSTPSLPFPALCFYGLPKMNLVKIIFYSILLFIYQLFQKREIIYLLCVWTSSWWWLKRGTTTAL